MNSKKRILYFKIITQKNYNDVGGWSNTREMGMAVGVAWDSLEQDYFTYKEKDAKILLEKIRTSDLVVGFNLTSEYTVLQPYTDFDLQDINGLDITRYIKKELDYRIGLHSLAKYNWGKEIDPSGLISFDLYKEGRIDQAIDIEKKYIGLVRDLHILGCQNGVIKYQDRMRKDQSFPVKWADLSSNIG